LRLLAVICGYLWLLMVTCGYLRLLVDYLGITCGFFVSTCD
jgi:hypothetical protein